MLKKVLCFAFTLCLMIVIAGCGQTPKEEAIDFDKKFGTKLEEIENKWTSLTNAAFDKFGDTEDADSEVVKSLPELILEMDNLRQEIEKQKVSKEIQPLKDAYIKKTQAWIEFWTLFSKVSPETVDDEDFFNQIKNTITIISQGGFDAKNTYSKLVDGQELFTATVDDRQLYGKTVSGVGILVYEAKIENQVGSSYFVKKPMGKFIIVGVVIANGQKDAITIDSNSFKLVNKQNQEFSTSSEGMSALQISEGHTKGFLTQLNPTMAINIKFVFDVPLDAKVDDFVLSARGGFSGDKLRLPLKVTPTGY